MREYRTYIPITNRFLRPRGSDLLRMFLYFHLIVVLFQIPIRAIFLDTTILRDFFPFVAVSLWILMVFSRGSVRTHRFSSLDKLFVIYLLLGLFLTFVWYYRGSELILALREFRNIFFPTILYFIAKKSITSAKYQAYLVNFCLIFLLIFLLDVFIEFVVLRIFGLSPYLFPWYKYSFKTSYRFIGNLVGAPGYIQPENSPILGLGGWTHQTAATIMGLFAFIYFFLIEKRKKYLPDPFLKWIARIPFILDYLVAFIATIVIIFMLQATTAIVSFAFLILVLPPLLKKERLSKNIIIAFILTSFLFLGAMNSYYIRSNLEGIKSGFISDTDRKSSLEVILNSVSFKVFSSYSLDDFFFGTSIDIGSIKKEGLSFGNELRIFYYGTKYGVLWLFIFVCIFVTGIIHARRIMKNRNLLPGTRLFAIGTIGLLCVYLIDMGHYAHVLFAPNIDIWAICLGALSAIYSKIRT